MERANVGKQLFPALRVKSRARLIEHEHFGFHRNDARDGHAALLSAGEGEGRLFQKVFRKAGKARGFAHTAVDLFFGKAHIRRAEGNVTVDRFFKELILRILEHKTHAESHVPDLLGICPDILPAEQDAASGGLQKAV